ncbi:hypothetical protein EQ826_15420 [Ectopseudomonas mendocina]|nr:hypothetical protein EQ826_15420 [Pseudomonas mendocina]
MIVGHEHLPSNEGRSCELLAYLESGDKIEHPNCPAVRMQYCEGEEPRWLVRGDSVQNNSDDPIDAGLDIILERYLMPLRGDFEPEEQKAREVEPCA